MTLITAKNGKARPKNPYAPPASEMGTYVPTPKYKEFESTVQWRDCPEATEDGEYEAELQWQCMYSWKCGQWIDVSDEWYEDMKDATANKYRQIYKLVTDHVEPIGTWLPGLYDILSGEERIGVYLDQKTIEYYKSINKWFQPSKTVRIVPQPKESREISYSGGKQIVTIGDKFNWNGIDAGEYEVISFVNSLTYSPSGLGGTCGVNLKNHKGELVEWCADSVANGVASEKRKHTNPVTQKEEAKTVEGNQSQAAFDIYEKNCVRDANLIIPVNPVITIIESMIEYSSQQNTALMEENERLIKAIEYALNKVYTLEHTQNGVKKYIRVDLLKAKTTLEEALKPKQ